MNQWISNKKNLPIIIAIAVVILIGAGVAVAFETGLIGAKPGVSTASAVPPSTPGAVTPVPTATPPGVPPGQAGAPGNPFAPGAASTPFGSPASHLPPGAPTTTPGQLPSLAAIQSSQLSPAQQAALMKRMSQITPQQQAMISKIENMTPAQKQAMEQKAFAQLKKAGIQMPNIPGMPGMPPVQTASLSRNPFAPTVNIKQLTTAAAPPPVTTYVPFTRIAVLPNPTQTTTLLVPTLGGGPATITVPLGRVAGVINSNGIRAIYEINGKDTIVTPGSLLPEDGGRVQSIQSDGITVRLPNSRQTVQVPITAGNPNQNAGSPYNPGGPPEAGIPPQEQGAQGGDVNND